MAEVIYNTSSADQGKQISSSACHCINLRRAANAVTSYYDSMIADTGLTLNQYSILCNIHRIEPCSVAALSRHIRLERTTLVRNLKALYTSGWIYDEANPGSRKSKVRLTESGLEKIQKAQPCWAQAQAHIENLLGKEALQKLTESLLLLEELSTTQNTP